MNLEQIEKRLAEIKDILTRGEGNVEELQAEVDKLQAERKKLTDAEEKRSAILEGLKNEIFGVQVRRLENTENDEFDIHKAIATDTYKRAFLKTLVLEELTKSERAIYDKVQAEYRAFTHTTANTSAVVPKGLVTEIISTMEENHPILGDISILRTGGVITIAKHTAIVAGDAKNVAEGEANVDEQNTFVDISLAGQDISKHVEYSYALGLEAIDGFEAFLVKELGERISSQWAKNVVAQIKKDLATANKFSVAKAGTLAQADVLKAMSLIKTGGNVNIYTSRGVIFSNIYTMTGADGKLAYIPNYQDGIKGTLLGSPIKQEDAIPAGEVLLLDPKKYVENVIQDILIERDKDIKRHVHIISGYMRTGGTMRSDVAGAIITIGTGV